MKTIFSLAILATLTLASCKKDYTCTCTVTTHKPAFTAGGTTYQQESTTSSSASSTIKDKEDEAKTECAKGNSTVTQDSPYASFGAEPTTITTTCAIN